MSRMSLLREKEIEKHCFLSSSYMRAKEIVKNKGINHLSLKKTEKDAVVIVALVRGNTKPEYQSLIKLSFLEERKSRKTNVEEWHCACEAYAQYKGFCKHIAAALLTANELFNEMFLRDIIEHCAIGYQLNYNRQILYGRASEQADLQVQKKEENGKTVEGRRKVPPFRKELLEIGGIERSFMYDASSNTLELSRKGTKQNWFGYSGAGEDDWETVAAVSKKRPKSSHELLDIMAGVELKQRNRYCRDISGGDVNLELLLNLDYNKPQIEFRIGSRHMYVVKNVDELLDNIKNQKFYRYGKQLEFSHQQSAFTRESLELIALLFDRVLAGNQLSYVSGSGEKRVMTLSPSMMDALFTGLSGKKILLSGELAERVKSIRIVEEDPLLTVTVAASKEGDKAVLVYTGITLFEGAERFYLLKDDLLYICSREFVNDLGELLRLMKKKEKYRYSHFFHDYEEEKPLEIAREDFTYFAMTLLPLMKKHMRVRVKGIDFEKYQAAEGNYEIYFSLRNGQDIVAAAKAVYGEKEHNLLTVADMNESYRDIRMEFELRQLLKKYLPEYTDQGTALLLKQDDEKLASLIEFGLEELKEIADVYLSEDFKKIRIAEKVKIKTGLSVKGNLLKVSWDVDQMPAQEIEQILKAYRKKKKYYRLKTGELLNIQESGMEVLGRLYDNLKMDLNDLKAGSMEVPLYRSLYIDHLVDENREKLEVQKDRSFMLFMEHFEETKTKKYALPKNLTAQLREYQSEGYRWLSSLAEFGFGGILADDMGLGKTLQTIAYLCSRRGKTHLVICPASLVYNWESECNRFAEDFSVCVVAGEASYRQKLIESYEQYDLLITSYDLLKRDIACYAEKSFGCEVIDEAQYIKNYATQASKAVRAIKSEVRFALTGTPVENRVSELWSIFDYIMPGYLYSYHYFREKFETGIMQSAESDDASLEMLHKMIRPFILRRLKKDVLKELPDKVEKVVYTRFEKEQRELYRATEKNILMNIGNTSEKEFSGNKIQILAELTRLRQICCDPALLYENYEGGSAKLEACISLVESAIDSGHKILLFSQFTTMLYRIESVLKKRKIKTFLLTGSTSKVGRRNLVERFQNGEAEVFLISLKAGGTGLNLTNADMVIHYDPWWNIAAQNQATDRVHRIGQVNKVTVIKLIAGDSIEERILHLQEKKRELADKLLSGENVSMASLTKEELMELFDRE